MIIKKTDLSNSSTFPKPGEIVVCDYRPPNTLKTKNTHGPLKCIQWNIERAYKLDAIISILKTYKDADIICLQELDIGCERSNLRDSVHEIGSKLEMMIAFVCEFEEIWCKKRSKKTQGGGVHGNAILSKWNLTNLDAIKHTEAFKWEERGHSIGEPRKGHRYAIATDVVIRDTLRIRVYSAHLELFCGIRKRIRQFEDVVTDAHTHHSTPHQLFFGDFNTMAHGVARLIPRYCQDGLRFTSLGLSEAEWWYKNILSDQTKSFLFFDPFDRRRDFTLWQVKGWFFRGKLDWTLLRGFNVLQKGMGNTNFEASDHRLLWVQIVPTDPLEAYLENLKSEQKLQSNLKLRLPMFLAVLFSLLYALWLK